ncbi:MULTISPECIES: YgfZ/GcvT domain-containing protein [Aphanothece]|uniref:CAF17-like 4Fe-4S cluster assembly/insertion protein YgfZ n=1 Tax=Aphanothece TaxID=1121 RepID=UPI0039851B44
METIWGWAPAQPARLERSVSLLHLTGPDTRRFLHGQTSAAIEQAAAGAWVPTCCIGPTGRMLALVEVLVEEQGAWLVVTAGDGAAVRQSLDRVLFPADQVTLGPLETALLVSPVDPPGEPAADATPLAWAELPGGGGWRMGSHILVPLAPGVPGSCPAELAQRPRLEPHEQERWRIQQGLPAVPGEINASTNPFELGLAERVSLAKGCYVGQETLAKLATYDGVKQQLRRWHSAGPLPPAQAPQPGERLVDPDDPLGGRLGTVTSVLQLPSGDWIGLALVRRQALLARELRLGDDPQGPRLQLSVPPTFVPPPVGAGAQAP